MSDELRELISSTATELNPENLDNQEVVETESEEIDDEDDIELEDDVVDTEDTEEEVEDEDIDEDEETSSDNDSKTFTVKVDGEVFEVTEKELKAGYQRQADYTREKQALKAEIEEFQQIQTEFTEQINAIKELDEAWSENPASVITQFTANTENPTQTVAMLIKDLAAANLLDSQFLQIFGITPEIQNEWRKESELNNLRSSQNKDLSLKDKKLQEAEAEIEVQQAIAEYDRQIDEIIDEEDLNFNTKQRTQFRQELAKYAVDNDLTNLKAAYKAFKYEEAKTRKKLAQKTIEKAKQKKATNVVSRSSSGEGNPLNDTSDLTAVIRQAMKEQSGN
jgi:hypothetical protein